MGSRVFVHGLASAQGQALNLKAGRVVHISEGRYGVEVPGVAPKLLKRMNLLNAAQCEDRQLFLQLLVLKRAKLRLVLPVLKHLLKDDLGLILLVASYTTAAPRCLFQFGGFMGKCWPESWCFAQPQPRRLAQPAKARLDSASCELSLGRVFFAGLMCSVAFCFSFSVAAPLKVVFPKKGSLFLQGH